MTYSVEFNWWIPLDKNLESLTIFLISFKKYKLSQSIIINGQSHVNVSLAIKLRLPPTPTPALSHLHPKLGANYTQEVQDRGNELKKKKSLPSSMTQHFYSSSLSSLKVFSDTAEWEVTEEVKETCKGKKKSFFLFWLHWVFIPAYQLSLVVVSRGCSSLMCTGFS